MEALGINIINLLINTALFFGFFFLIHKFVLSRIGEILEKRQKIIEEGVVNYNKSKQVLEKVSIEKKELLDHAKKEANEIIRDARKTAEEETRRILKEAEEEAKQIKHRANKAIEIQKDKLEKEFNARLEKETKIALKNILKDSDKTLIK